MFTGIVEELGRVRALDRHEDSVRLSVEAPQVSGDLRHGDSVAVNGVCLTVTDASLSEGFVADVMRETITYSTLADLHPDEAVNLERAVRASDRLGGHIVQGHVDGVGTVVSRQPGERWDVVRIALPPGLARYVVHKGSLAVDGVSLTVSAVDDDAVEVSLIPATLRATTLGQRKPDERVNLEVDVIAKYTAKSVESLVERAGR